MSFHASATLPSAAVISSDENAKKKPSSKSHMKKQADHLLEDTYLELHKTIVALETATAGADSRRRTELLDSCKTLDDLHGGLLREGYVLSK